jgi:hypothetical protein
VPWEERLKRGSCFLCGSKQASSVADSTTRPCIQPRSRLRDPWRTTLDNDDEENPPQNFSSATRKSIRIDRGRRAAAKSLVHLSRPSGEKVEFDDETRSKLQSALSRLKPAPSPQNANRMISVSKLVVSNLNTARDKVEKKTETATEERALRDLLDCAMTMRDACVAAFDSKQLTYALNTRLMLGVIKTYDPKVDSERELYKALKVVEKIDFFGKFGKHLMARLDIVIKATSPLIRDVNAAKRITSYHEYSSALKLANRWLQVFETPPTFCHFERDEDGRQYEFSPFQSFVAALPLDRPIKEEVLRTAVETIQELQGF